MPARFRIFDNGGETIDRYTIFDSWPMMFLGQTVYSYAGFNGRPFHPQGFGQHGEIDSNSWMEHCKVRFRPLGKRILGKDLHTEDARKFVLQFMKSCNGSKASIRTTMGNKK